MDVIAIYDYYFYTNPYRVFNTGCRFTVCKECILYKRLACTRDVESSIHDNQDILEYMLYNVSGETGLPSYYSCCMEYDGGHVCNAIPVMIGSKLERHVVNILCEMLGYDKTRRRSLYDCEYLHSVYAGTFLINGTFYYSVFRESNNNKICHNTKSKFRGEETVVYFYDMKFNRGIKLFTTEKNEMRVNDRDGREVAEVTPTVLSQLYKECLNNPAFYTLDMEMVQGFFAAVKKEGFTGIDDFKNKIYTNYSIGLNAFFNKLHPSAMSYAMWNTSIMMGKINLGISQRLSYPKSKSEVKKQNEQKLKMCSGVMSTGYLVETQRRRNVRKIKNQSGEPVTGEPTIGGTELQGSEQTRVTRPQVIKQQKTTNIQQFQDTTYAGDKIQLSRQDTPTTSNIDCSMFGSNEIKTLGLMEKLEDGEKSGPSIFNQVSVSYLPLIRVLSTTVQKLQVEHVHAESSKTVADDAVGFICMKYMGNISTAGKNMLFVDRVRVSYGHVHSVVTELENALDCMCRDKVVFKRKEEHKYDRNLLHIVLNNVVTQYSLYTENFFDVIICIKCFGHRYAWTRLCGAYLCLYFYEGVPLLEMHPKDDDMACQLRSYVKTDTGLRLLTHEKPKNMYFTRNELEVFAYTIRCLEDKEPEGFSNLPIEYVKFMELNKQYWWDRVQTLSQRQREDPYNVQRTDYFIRKWFKKRHEVEASCSSKLAEQLDQFTEYTPPSKRSVSVNARKSACINVYYLKAALLIRGFNIYTDPESYERKLSDTVERRYGIPSDVTMCKMMNMRSSPNNCPQPQYDEQMASYMYHCDELKPHSGDASICTSLVKRKSNMHQSYIEEKTDCNRAIVAPIHEDRESSHKEITQEDKILMRRGLKRAEIMMLRNFYMLRTIFADIDGYNVEDANVIDTGVDLCMSFSYSFSLTFVDRTTKDVEVIVPNPEDSTCVCSWDEEGKPLAVLFMVCVIRPNRGSSYSGETKTNIQFIDAESDNGTTIERNNSSSNINDNKSRLHFPPFRKLSVLMSTDGSYHVYFIRNDAVLLRAMESMRKNASDGISLDIFKPFDALQHLSTRVSRFRANKNESIVTIDTRVYGSVDKYNGLKVVNSFGQKGLALIKDLEQYIPTVPNDVGDGIPVQLVMNVCSFISRCPIGQCLQMKKNLCRTAYSISGEPCLTGFSSVFFTENEPTTKTCLVRFDEMMRSVIITVGLPCFQNVKNSLDNVYNPNGLVCPPQTRQIMDLYRCYGVAYRLAGDDYVPYATRDQIMRIFTLFDRCIGTIKEESNTTLVAKLKKRKIKDTDSLGYIASKKNTKLKKRKLKDTDSFDYIASKTKTKVNTAGITTNDTIIPYTP